MSWESGHIVFHKSNREIKEGTLMKRTLWLCFVLALLAGMWWMKQPGSGVMAASAEKNVFTPDAIPYGPAPVSYTHLSSAG